MLMMVESSIEPVRLIEEQLLLGRREIYLENFSTSATNRRAISL